MIQIAENGLFDKSTPHLEMKRNVLRISLVLITFLSAYAIPVKTTIREVVLI